MRLRNFLSSRRDQKVFSEASALAVLRLEQCLADLRMQHPAVPVMSKAIRPAGVSAVETSNGAALGSKTETPDLQCLLAPILNVPTTVAATALRTEEIILCLRTSLGRRMRVTFADGVVQTVIVGPVDDVGFLHCDADAEDGQAFWTRFKDVEALETESNLL